MNTIIFDMDGVIFDTERLCMDSWQAVATEHGMGDISATFRKCIGTNDVKTREIVLQDMGQDFPYDIFRKEASIKIHQDMQEYGMRLLPGVKELLQYLKENHYKIGLASSTRQQVVEMELKMAEIYDYFQVIVCGDMVRRSKPEPDIYLCACEKIGTKPKEAYAIEDSYHGIRAADAAGMKPIMVPDLTAPDAEMWRLSTHIFSSLFEVCNSSAFG